jgi:hypothetical protein
MKMISEGSYKSLPIPIGARFVFAFLKKASTSGDILNSSLPSSFVGHEEVF